MTQRTVLHEGCPLSFSERGAGPPVLFIQGVGVHGDGWKPQVDALADAHRCVWFDNRGLGRSQPRGAAITLARMAGDARAVLDAAQIERAHVVGHSLGGLVAQELALGSPGRVLSLLLLCTMARGRDAARTAGMLWLGIKSRLGTARARRRAFLRIVMPDAALARVDRDALAAELAPLFGHDLARHPTVELQQLRALRDADTSARLSALAVRTLVVSATHDRIAPPALGRALRDAIPGARYAELDGQGHGAPILCAAAVNDLLRAHLRGA